MRSGGETVLGGRGKLMYGRVIAMTTVWVMSTRWVTSKNDEISSKKVDVLDSDMSEKVAPDRNYSPLLG
jgi:hypothetical protein